MTQALMPLLVFLAAAGAETAPPEDLSKRVGDLISRLGDREFRVREEASDRLLELAADDPEWFLAHLPESDGDAEIRSRLAEIRRRVRFEKAFRIARTAGRDAQALQDGIARLRDEPTAGEIVSFAREAKGISPSLAAKILVALPIDAMSSASEDGEGKGGFRVALTQGLGILADPEGIRALLPLLSDPDANVRRSALWALGQIRQGVDPAKVAPLLKDGNPGVAYEAARTLAFLEGKEAPPPQEEGPVQ